VDRLLISIPTGQGSRGVWPLFLSASASGRRMEPAIRAVEKAEMDLPLSGMTAILHRKFKTQIND
jgi:hypothetical protein